MDFLIILCYFICAFGACNVIAFGSGPFRVFEHVRYLAKRINSHFGEMFTCMMCLPANFGWIASILNWFFIPVAFTPFNIIFNDLDLSWWWLVILCDGALTSGIVWLLYRLDEFMEPQKTDIDTQFCNKFGFSELADEKKQLLLD